MYLFNILILLMICVSCTNITLIEEQPAGQKKSPDPDNGPDQVLVKELENFLTQIAAKNSTISALEIQVQDEKKAIDTLYDSIRAMNFLDENENIGLDESTKLFDIHSQIDALMQKINVAKLSDLGDEIKELAENGHNEQLKLPDNKEVRSLADQIKSSETTAKASILNIKTAEESLGGKKEALEAKIDEAGKNFKSHFGSGDKKTDLDAVLLKLTSAKSLKDINDIIVDKNFFSLRAEIKAYDPNFDDAIKKVRDLFGDGLTNGLIKKAKDQKSIIDGYLSVVPPNWEKLMQDTVELDRLLENNANQLENKAKVRVTSSVMEQLLKQLEDLTNDKSSGKPFKRRVSSLEIHTNFY